MTMTSPCELAIELDEPFPAKLTLDVTAADCERGQRRDDYRCPTARAAARRFDGADIRAGSGWVEVRHERQTVTYLVPHDLRRQILSFDAGEAFAPGSYVLTRYDDRPRGFGHALRLTLSALAWR